MEVVKRLAREEKIKPFLRWVRESSGITYYHSIKTALYTEYLAESLPYNKREKEDIIRGALLHDIGKAALRNEIVEKTDRLTGIDIEYIHMHSMLGYFNVFDIFGAITSTVVLQHHEKLDGSGYPFGIRDIPDYVQAVTVADMYDALTSERCYKKAYTHEQAVRILMQDAADGKINADYIRRIDRYVKKECNYHKPLHNIIPSIPFPLRDTDA